MGKNSGSRASDVKGDVSEGAVLLKNIDGVLPFSSVESEKVNVFGWASVDWAYGANSASCSGRVMAENDDAKELIDLYDALEEYNISYVTRLTDLLRLNVIIRMLRVERDILHQL